jgi:nitroimidazol reductase NimA-like FMN-containing flavoprotein (pyridoxamine 5'-phosphate oxidase superfamily)
VLASEAHLIMGRIPAALALSPAELDELMTTSRTIRVATVGLNDRLNLTPVWFGWGGGRIYFFARGHKIVNLRRNPTCTALVDRGETYRELQGAMFQGVAHILEDAAAEAADPRLEEVRWQMGAKYASASDRAAAEPARNTSTARPSGWRWVGLEPQTVVTWDNTKLGSSDR